MAMKTLTQSSTQLVDRISGSQDHATITSSIEAQSADLERAEMPPSTTSEIPVSLPPNHHSHNNNAHDDNETAPFPDGGLPASLVVLGAFLLLLPSFGLMVSTGTLQSHWHTHQLSLYTTRDIGWIPSLFVYLSLSLSIFIGPIFDSHGPRPLALPGSVLYVAMMLLLAQCRSYWHFLLTLGVLGGVTGAMLTTTALSCVAHWFEKKRALATGVAMTGSTIGGVLIPLILKTTLPRFGYAWSIRILACLFTACLLLGNILLKARLPPKMGMYKNIISPGIFLDLRFSLLTLSIFGMELVLFGALGLLPTYYDATTRSKAALGDAGFTLLALLNGTSCLGRLLPALWADKYGRFNVLLISMALTLLTMLTLWLPFGSSSLPVLYVFVALFGFGTGSWMALIPACIGQLCEAREFGRYYGTAYFGGSLATLVCIPIGGELLEALGGRGLVGFMCGILGGSGIVFAAARWACLGRRWGWSVKV